MIKPAYLAMRVLMLFNKKVADRENSWKNLLDNFDSEKFSKKRIWFHASSMGEFEQAKPIIENLKLEMPDVCVIVSFYSPSGYNNQKHYKFADYILYMPFDLHSRASEFILKINPLIAVFVRYDLWYNHLSVLKELEIPTYLICATKTNSDFYLQNSLLNSIYLNNLNLINFIYTAGKTHTRFFESLDINPKIITSADTRFDRIISKVEELKQNPLEISSLFKDKIVFIAGSTWREDEEILKDFFIHIKKKIDNLVLIIVPHEPTSECIEKLSIDFSNSILFSELTNLSYSNLDLKNEVILVDSIGNLLKLYSIANYAYVGGAFGDGIHSVAEPAGFGIPIFFGTNYSKSLDAVNLIKQKTAFSITFAEEIYDIFLKLIKDTQLYEKISTSNRDYIYSAQGESERLSKVFIEKLNTYSEIKSNVSEV